MSARDQIPAADKHILKRASRLFGFGVYGVRWKVATKLWGPASGFYLPDELATPIDEGEIIIPEYYARAIRHQRTARRGRLRAAILTLGHELRHRQQQRHGMPYDEDDAEKYARTHFDRIRIALGIHRDLGKPPRW